MMPLDGARWHRAPPGRENSVDYARLFSSIPTPYLVMTPDLVIVEANEAYLAVVGRRRDDIVGRPVFEAFPPLPDALDDTGVSRVQRSFERARDAGVPDTMPVQKYDIPDASGGYVERYWSLISVPVLDDAGRTVLVVQRTEDVTEYVRERERRRDATQHSAELRRRTEEAEADLYARSQELDVALQARDAAGRRLSALAEVALQLGHTESVEELTAVVVERGVAALGADGGAVAVRTGDELSLVITGDLGERTQAVYGRLPVDGPLPGSMSARGGQEFWLPDRAACLAHHESMRHVLDDTGCEAWVCLPLEGDGRLLGSLSVGWRDAHAFGTAEREVLRAMAAQCAQNLARLQAREVERRSTAAVMRMSETLQRSLLTEPPQPDHLQIAVRYRPAAREAQVGGDWYDAFITPDGATNLVIGDVAGHDRIAAAAMGQVRNLLRGIAYTVEQPPDRVLASLDRAIRDLAVGALATAVLARVEQDPDMVASGDRRLRWANAGHPPPLLLAPDGTVEVLHTEADLLLGIDPDSPRHHHVRVLRPGATVLLYSDGLIERREQSIDEGLRRLVATAERLGGHDLERLCDGLLAQAGGRQDDVAILALRAHPQDAPRPPEAGCELLPAEQAEARLANVG